MKHVTKEKMMKERIIATCILLCGVMGMWAQDSPDAWYYGEYDRHRPSPKAKEMQLVKVEGNHFITADGNTILFRGIAISDPDKVARQGHWNKEHFAKVKELGANIVRIPVHPVAWRERTPEAYLKMLDEAVDWCTDLKLYVMIDWHTIGNLELEMFQDPMYITTKQETFDFWRKIAKRFAGHNTVAFYELFNEPTIYRGQLGTCTWPEWKKLVENMITIIRYSDKETIPIVSGFDWAYDLTPLHREPINATGIAYSVHPYSNKSPQPWAATWEQNFGFAAKTYPVFATEFGFDSRTPVDLDENHYGNQIIDYLESNGMSWCIWVYDPDWGGGKIKSWNYEPTESMKFFSEGMKGKLKVQNKKK